ncbi:MAG: hypothetical protein A2W71_02430 [Candidatus Nealsonbacteria bacterium RIFCSPLOWO2_02_39_8]|uniref:Peptidase M50 domain-containing protein n=1 Tax=Candidatus Nealsonbacteria bacterium RIFCSPLOWO2_02_39_8 TaxID=1801674 RepID=A0A1G2EHG1_9BACT|nr:MAG: Membrane-associated zinc metalloprotease [Parcubacteria group bacterium GW2011_GWA2_38_27]OGZ21184.1 MAG: hypothetical protein A2W55_02205 [Candidatus Nealsonbacteria bacterium RIFCSPHIGHO2_02_38_10]OGZ25207.1 MAG: hypothetical protein A2W71_02430 [Candidatus Nealsonbacteria bacterium RIFCSPLOWO2_02_39_8]OGZ25945.1 MAG: hypothetical protein A3I85_00680 [Candidatus Nealsonbacteria bacterium RIFCSPLOWO2_02_FULL_38_63]
MVLSIVIAFFCLIGLAILHEYGHFIAAKKFGVGVEEFGIGYPPRIFGKKFRGTIYSINLLPFGAFVKIKGENNRTNDQDSFNGKPFWKKSLIILAGVISFWLAAIVILSVVMWLGAPTIIEDNEKGIFTDLKVQIIGLAPGSPAKEAGIEVGDAIKEFKYRNVNIKIKDTATLQELIKENQGREITLAIERGGEVKDVFLILRANPPEGQGAMGVILARTAMKSYPWYLAPIEGIKATGQFTISVLEGWGIALARLAQREPTGVQIMGPVGIFGLFAQTSRMGVSYFLQFIAIISIYIAVFNILPIPMVDGGKFLFLVIEKIRGKQMNQKTENGINAAFFTLLVMIMFFVTIKDIAQLF